MAQWIQLPGTKGAEITDDGRLLSLGYYDKEEEVFAAARKHLGKELKFTPVDRGTDRLPAWKIEEA